MKHKKITLAEVEQAAFETADYINADFSGTNPVYLYGVPRGGIVPVVMVQRALEVYMQRETKLVADPTMADVIIDDIEDSGKTRERIMRAHPSKKFYALFKRDAGEPYYDFPWELNEQGEAIDNDIPIRLLQYIGEDPSRGGLKETPKRFLKAWNHYTSGYDVDFKKLLKVFKDGAEKCDEMVLVRNIPVYSHCEHHLAPFFGVAHVGYIPNGSIVGLSKLSRLVDAFARRLQVQERLTNQIADALNKHLEPKGVAVVVECRHMCMEARGIQQQGHSTITSAMRGVLLDDDKARAEFMGLIK